MCEFLVCACVVFVVPGNYSGVNALVRQLTSFIDTEMRVTQGLATLTVRQSGFRDLMSSEETDFLDGQCHTVRACMRHLVGDFVVVTTRFLQPTP